MTWATAGADARVDAGGPGFVMMGRRTHDTVEPDASDDDDLHAPVRQ